MLFTPNSAYTHRQHKQITQVQNMLVEMVKCWTIKIQMSLKRNVTYRGLGEPLTHVSQFAGCERERKTTLRRQLKAHQGSSSGQMQLPSEVSCR